MELEDGSRTLKREEQVTFGTENDIFVQVKRTKKKQLEDFPSVRLRPTDREAT
jgi:hypothetical protein